jgi:hypothetical protein
MSEENTFTMEDYEEFEQLFRIYIDDLPVIMSKEAIFPTVDNIKQCLISFIMEYDKLPENVKEDMCICIEDEETFCNMVSHRDEIKVNEIEPCLIEVK